jgi:hypothetical protein
MKLTVPVGMPWLGIALDFTVALRVTDRPQAEGIGDETNVVVVTWPAVVAKDVSADHSDQAP